MVMVHTLCTVRVLYPLMQREHAGKGGGVTMSHCDQPFKYHHKQTQPGGGFLLGLLTLLTMHVVNAEGQRAQERA